MPSRPPTSARRRWLRSLNRITGPSHPRRLIVAVLALACGLGHTEAHAQSDDGPVIHVDFDRRSGNRSPAKVEADDGPAGPYGRFDADSKLPAFKLPSAVEGTYSISLWFRTREYAGGGNDKGFGPATPPTLAALIGPQREPAVVLRLRQQRLELSVTTGPNIFVSARAETTLDPDTWHHAAVTHDGKTAVLYLDGREALSKRVPPPAETSDLLWLAQLGKRAHLGDLDEVQLHRRVLSAAEIAQQAGVAPPTDESAQPAEPQDWRPRVNPLVYADRTLRLTDDAVADLAEGGAAQAEWVPWFDGQVPDAILRTYLFNGQLLLWTDGRWDADTATLTYHRQVRVADSPWADQLAGGPYWRVDRGTAGAFDLISESGNTGLDREDLVYFANVGRPGQPAFAPPYALSFGGRPFGTLCPETPGRTIPCFADDLDGDGTTDFLYAKLEGKRYPDGSVNFWQHRQTRYAGKGRSYSVNDQYLGEPSRAEFFWSRGQRDADGKLSFSQPLPVTMGDQDFPLIWKGPLHARAAAITIRGRRHLLLTGSLDQVLVVPFTVDRDAIRCGPAQPLLAGDARVRHVYLPHHLSVADLDGDGHDEVLYTGNPGSLSVLHGTDVGNYTESPVRGVGGDVRMQTLVVPQRLDWDGDAHPDLLVGDASGFFKIFPGTADPSVYQAPRPLTLHGQPWHHQPAETASIQGVDEARWGYVNPLAVDWDGDGRLDVLYGETTPRIMWARGLGGLEVDTPRPLLTADGQPWKVAWRQRPAAVPTAPGQPRRLLVQDWDGDLALAEFDPADPRTVTTQRKLTYATGSPIRTSGPVGFWGRGKPTVADWDGDGDWDIVYGGHGGNNRYVDPSLPDDRAANVMIFENSGSSQHPEFERPRLLTLDGQPLALGKHVAAVWPTDLDDDGHLDVIVGTDDGRVYAFNRRELEESAP